MVKSVAECHICGGKTETIDSRKHGKNGAVRRRRKCAECGDRFTTYEIRDGLLETLLNSHMSMLEVKSFITNNTGDYTIHGNIRKNKPKPKPIPRRRYEG